MFCNPCFGGPNFVGPAATGPVCTAPPVVHPTKYCDTQTFSTTVVPHIHPTHNTLINHQLIQNQHYFPQTQSVLNTVSQTDVPGYGPVPQVAGAMTGPGPYGPGPYGPGPYGPGPYGGYPSPMVAGAMTGPVGGVPGMMDPGMPGMVAGASTGPGMNPMGAGAANANPMVGGMFKK
ncbi:spore coat protein [Ectobacillus funiculus]|uniref:spore coat protein n=1 Tax=Ectobacillus funiculus TaxID=137993 RepID=UPI00101BF7A9|nr:spore coat protein [Ectobacillus funiculus]